MSFIKDLAQGKSITTAAQNVLTAGVPVSSTDVVPAEKPGTYVDRATFVHLDPYTKTIDGATDVTWILAAGQDVAAGEKNGIYKRGAAGDWQFQGYGTPRIGVTGGTFKNTVFSRNLTSPIFYTNESGVPNDRAVTTATGGPFAPVATNVTPEKQPDFSTPATTEYIGDVPNVALYKGSPILTGTLPGNTGINPSAGVPTVTASGAKVLPDFLKNVDPLLLMGILVAVVGGAFLILKHRK